VKFDSLSGNASEPIWFTVTFGFVIVNFISYSSFCSASINALAASTSKFTPSTSGYIVNGSLV